MLQKDMVSMESKQRSYLLDILRTNSKFSIDLLYNNTDLLAAKKYDKMLLIKQSVRIRQLMKQEPRGVSVGT